MPATVASTSDRLVALDALRGFDMLWIVGGGSVVKAIEDLDSNAVTAFLTKQLTHAEWAGFRFYDLVFPLFLFVMGVSLVFSLDRLLDAGGRSRALKRVVVRSAALFALGVFATGGIAKPWPDVALGGVLHRIAACYLLASMVYLVSGTARSLVLASAVMLVGYWALLTYVPIPDLRLEKQVVEEIAARIGSMSPAAISASVPERVTGSYEEGRNLTNYLDFRFMPGRKPQIYYLNEGLLSTLPATALPLCGALAGLLLRHPGIRPTAKVLRLAGAGVTAIAVGMAWSTEFPLVKRIWTSSFVLVAAGASACLLAAFYWIVDVRGRRAWCRPFVWIGSNPLLIYVASPIIGFQSLAARLVGGDVRNFLDAHVGRGTGGMVVAATGLTLVVVFARFLYRNGIFLRV